MRGLRNDEQHHARLVRAPQARAEHHLTHRLRGQVVRLERFLQGCPWGPQDAARPRRPDTRQPDAHNGRRRFLLPLRHRHRSRELVGLGSSGLPSNLIHLAHSRLDSSIKPGERSLTGAAAGTAPLGPIDPWYRLALVRRAKAAFSSGCKSHPATGHCSRKQSKRSWR